MARGSWLPLDCFYERAGLCPGRRPSGPTPSGEGRLTDEKGAAMEVMFDRVTSLDVGKDSVTVCVRAEAGAA
jgi:hypothetical protein